MSMSDSRLLFLKFRRFRIPPLGNRVECDVAIYLK